MSELEQEAPNEQTTGRESDIPIPKVGTQAPSGELPPLVGELSVEPIYTSKRKRRSKKQDAEPEQAPAPQPVIVVTPEQRAAIGDAIGEGIKVAGTMAVAVRGPHWQPVLDAAPRLGHLWAIALEPWLATSGKYVPLAVAVLATAGVVMPCVQEDSRRAKELAAGGPVAREPLEVLT